MKIFEAIGKNITIFLRKNNFDMAERIANLAQTMPCPTRLASTNDLQLKCLEIFPGLIHALRCDVNIT